MSISSSGDKAEGIRGVRCKVANEYVKRIQRLANLRIDHGSRNLNRIFARLLARHFDLLLRSVSRQCKRVNATESFRLKRVAQRLVWRGIPLEMALGVCSGRPLDFVHAGSGYFCKCPADWLAL